MNRVRDTVTFRIGTPLHRVEQMMIQRTLEYVDDDETKAARLLGISVKTVRRKRKQFPLLDHGNEKVSEFQDILKSEISRDK